MDDSIKPLPYTSEMVKFGDVEFEVQYRVPYEGGGDYSCDTDLFQYRWGRKDTAVYYNKILADGTLFHQPRVMPVGYDLAFNPNAPLFQNAEEAQEAVVHHYCRISALAKSDPAVENCIVVRRNARETSYLPTKYEELRQVFEVLTDIQDDSSSWQKWPHKAPELALLSSGIVALARCEALTEWEFPNLPHHERHHYEVICVKDDPAFADKLNSQL